MALPNEFVGLHRDCHCWSVNYLTINTEAEATFLSGPVGSVVNVADMVPPMSAAGILLPLMTGIIRVVPLGIVKVQLKVNALKVLLALK